VVGSTAAELRVTQVRDATQHGRDPPVRPPPRVLNLGKGSWPVGRGGQRVEKFAHEVAAAVVEREISPMSSMVFCGAC